MCDHNFSVATVWTHAEPSRPMLILEPCGGGSPSLRAGARDWIEKTFEKLESENFIEQTLAKVERTEDWMTVETVLVWTEFESKDWESCAAVRPLTQGRRAEHTSLR